MRHIIEFQEKNGLKADGIVGWDTIKEMCRVFGICTHSQAAHFLANVHHETGGFSNDTENLNYSAAGLAKTWPGRFVDAATKQPNVLAKNLAKKQQAIANNVYANRMGNGSESSGDGWKYRGRGSLQLTGKKNYSLFAEFIKDRQVVLDPDIVATKYFWESAIFYFTKNKLWDKMNGSTPADVKAVRKAVNGGYIGLNDVQKKFTYYYNLITQ